MSRSYKKSPAWTDHHTPGTSYAKRYAVRAVRLFSGDVSNGKWYRRLYNPWNICDYRFYKTKQQAILEWEKSDCPWDQAMTRSEVINEWEKQYRRK